MRQLSSSDSSAQLDVWSHLKKGHLQEVILNKYVSNAKNYVLLLLDILQKRESMYCDYSVILVYFTTKILRENKSNLAIVTSVLDQCSVHHYR